MNIQKIKKQLESIDKKVEALSGEYLTNTSKRQREQAERDHKKVLLRAQREVLDFLLKKAEKEGLSKFEEALVTSAFYEDMRCFSKTQKYSENNPFCRLRFPPSDDPRSTRLLKAGISDTDELIRAIKQFNKLIEEATTPPDLDAIRLRDLLFKARLAQGGDIQFTPEPAARALVSMANIHAGSRVLEPEAGIGSLADAAREITENVDCIELSSDFREILKLKKHNVVWDDLMDAEVKPDYDAVVMNPPFSEECEHIQKAFEFVKPGGRLAAICSGSLPWKTTRKYQQFRDWLAQYSFYFAEIHAPFEKTKVAVNVLVLDK